MLGGVCGSRETPRTTSTLLAASLHILAMKIATTMINLKQYSLCLIHQEGFSRRQNRKLYMLPTQTTNVDKSGLLNELLQSLQNR